MGVSCLGGSALIASSYYIVQRTCQMRLLSDQLAAAQPVSSWLVALGMSASSLDVGARAVSIALLLIPLAPQLLAVAVGALDDTPPTTEHGPWAAHRPMALPWAPR